MSVNKRNVLLLVLMGTVLCLPTAHANHGYKGSSHGSLCGGGIEKKFFHKAHMILKNEDELKLSDDQVGKIKSLKLSVKKDIILQGAEIEVLGLDIRSMLKDHSVDLKSVNTLIDQKYELKKAKTKQLVEAYAELKSVLSEDQYESLKDLWKKSS